MDGDLSLSQSLGGLRIANPDDASLNSSEDAAVSAPGTAASAAAPDAHDHHDHHQPATAIPDDPPPSSQSSIPPPFIVPDDYSLRSHSRQTENRSSIYSASDLQQPPLHHQQQLPTSHPAPSSSSITTQPAPQYSAYHPQQHSAPPGSARPLSSFYANNGSSPALVAREGSYRIRTDSAASSASESQARTDSRGGSSALQAGVLARDNSHSDRAYRTAHIPGNKVMRQTSRAHARGAGPGPGPGQLAGSPYGLENGPSPSSEEWQHRGAAVAVRQEIDANGKPISRYIKKGVRDFSFGQTLGEGSYSTVVLATDRQTLKEYAIKILDKRHIIKEKKVKYVNIEKDTLNRLTEHPGVVRLYYTFQDERSLYFVLDLCKGGELLGVLKRMTTFDEECTRFYSAQILDAIDYMHKRGVIHRDLKPENVLLDSQMYIKITDFGTAKILKNQQQQQQQQQPRRPDQTSADSNDNNNNNNNQGEERASSFVGTAEYVSPELLTEKNACKASDLWAFGCIVFQLLAGRPPFKAGNEYQTFQKIVALEYEFPLRFPFVARDLVERLLVLDPAERLPIDQIKNHPFFEGVSWGSDLWRRKAPRLKAYVPPPREPIKLNGGGGGGGGGSSSGGNGGGPGGGGRGEGGSSGGGEADSYPPNIAKAPSTTTTASSRVVPRLVTELPPPSQLDIEWSPVLTKTNERILKMGNLMVLSSPASHSPVSKNGSGELEAPKKFSRFFAGSTTKKRQRLVMITSSARIIMAASGGDEKKAKLEVSLLSRGTSYRTTTDSKGLSSWIVDTRDKRFVFEDPKPSSSNLGATALSAQEWLDALDRAKEMASHNNSGDEGFRDISSGMSSHTNTLDRSSDIQGEGPPGGRATLIKHQATDTESVKGRKRFSRRHSKNGLAAVF